MTNNTSKSQHLYPFGEIDCWFVKYPHLTFKPSSTTHSIFYMEISVHILPISWTSLCFSNPLVSVCPDIRKAAICKKWGPYTSSIWKQWLGSHISFMSNSADIVPRMYNTSKVALRGTSATFHQLLCNATFSSKSKVC